MTSYNEGERGVTFINGIIAGAGAVIAIMAYVFMQLVGRFEGVMGITTYEMRVAIILGAIVCAAAIGYEFYRKKQIQQGVQSQGAPT